MPTGVYKRNGKELEKANKHLHYVENTKLEGLTQKISKNNKSGVKGVSVKNNRNCVYYEASIQLNKKRISKSFKDINDAINWRKEKEEELYNPILKKYGGDK